MARPKTPDGKRITVATKVSEPTAAAIDAQRGPVTRSEWLADAAAGALDGYRHERTDRCHHRAEHLLTCDEYDALRARARGCCEICGTPEPETKRGQLVIDHYEDRATWYIRGLLCDQCNQVMSCHDGHKPWGANSVWKNKAAEYASRAFQQPSKTPRARKTLITYRVDEDLYAAVAAKAASEGETIADVLTRGLTAFVAAHTGVEPPVTYDEPASGPPCRHPADQVDGTECRACGADVWLERGEAVPARNAGRLLRSRLAGLDPPA